MGRVPSRPPPHEWLLDYRRTRARERQQQIGERIRQARMYRDLTQETVAHAVGVARTTIIGIEAGAISPRLELLLVLADVLDWDLADLVRGPDAGAPGQR